MLARIAGRLAELAQRFVPDPFVIALGLSALAFGLGWLVMPEPTEGGRAAALAAGWLARFTAPDTLAFTTQMALILVAGSTLARAKVVRGVLSRLADLPRTTASAAALTALVAMVAAFLNWGFGLVAGAVLAREIGARASAARRPLDYPLVATAGYVGLMVWHGGLSGSAPLKVAESGVGDGTPPIPLSETLFSPLNLALTVGLLLLVPWLFARMASAGRERVWKVAPLAEDDGDAAAACAAGSTGEHAAPDTGSIGCPRSGWGSALLLLFILALGTLALAGAFARAGALRGLSLNTVILILLLLGLLLFRSPQRYARAFAAGAGEAGGILLQFPFYFGILGLLEASGLVQHLAGGTAGAARALAELGLPLQWCFDMVTLLSAGLVNQFVPSGGGQWAVQGPIVVQAAGELHLPVSRAVMALAYGDEWTNMLQPFWALPLLGITGLRARDIMGYSATLMLASGALFALALLLF
jgi:short-chain fatty acids transporter